MKPPDNLEKRLWCAAPDLSAALASVGVVLSSPTPQCGSFLQRQSVDTDINSLYECDTGGTEPQYMWYDKDKQEGGVHKHDT